MKTAFVTGATGLLGNNLVRLLVRQGHRVQALVRDQAKASAQFHDLPPGSVQWVLGDIRKPSSYQAALRQADCVLHTAAYFRDSYKGGNHSQALFDTNVQGTQELMEAAHAAGVRRMVHVSSIAVLGHQGRGADGLLTEEDLYTDGVPIDDYYRSKIDTDSRVYRFLDTHPDMHISLVLPGWMHGPGDRGPTSAGQFVLDYMRGKLPGVVDAAISLVDARDVAAVVLAAAKGGQRGQRYLAAGHPLSMQQLFAAMEQVSGQAAPTRRLPTWLVFAIATVQEAYARLTGQSVLLSLATVRNMVNDHGRRFSAAKIQREFGLGFRPVDETLRDELGWYRKHGYLG